MNILDGDWGDIYKPLLDHRSSSVAPTSSFVEQPVKQSLPPKKSEFKSLKMWFDDFSDRFFDMGFNSRRPFGLSSRLRREFAVPRDVVPSSRTMSSTQSDADKRLQVTKDGVQMCLNVYQFSPSEITVKTVDDVVIIEGKHEEKQDEHGYVTRQFTRRYKLPKEYDPKDVVSTMSSDGVLTIRAPSIVKPAPQVNERVITIQQTGPAETKPASESVAKEIPIKEEMN